MTQDGKQPATKIRVNCAGYQGKAVSVFAAYDPSTDVLAIVRESSYEVAPREGFLRVTTRAADPTHDMVFSEDETKAAIAAFFDLDAMQLVQYMDGLTRLNPTHRIEHNGMDEHGVVYRISPDITNGQVAVLIAAYAAHRQRSVAAMAGFFEATDLGEVITI